MSVLDASALRPELYQAVTTNVDDITPMTSKGEIWWQVVERTLLQWEQDPSLLEEEGMEIPSIITIREAIRLANALFVTRSVPPTRIVPDGNGGIVFERQEGIVYETIELLPDKEPEYCLFQNAQLLHRHTFSMNDL